MRVTFIMLLISVAFSSKIFSQDSTFHYALGVSAAASSSSVPFWLHANRNGSVPTQKSFALFEARFHRVYNPNNPRFFQWSGGAELIGNAGKKTTAFFSDLFIAGKAGPVELSVGQRSQATGLADTLLTSGSFAMSNNYRPYPKIEISTVRFVSILPLNDIFSFKFSYSDGLFGPADVHYGNVSRISESYFHQKSLYLKLGRNRHRLNLFAGFNHQVMWGGEDKIFSGGLERKQAYNYIVFGKPWASSRVGNHFGTIDVAADWKGDQWGFFLYRQSVYEDGSLSNLSNLADGLNGFRIKRNQTSDMSQTFRINTVLIEFLYTKNQGGNIFDFNSGTFGRDNYFNHYVYNKGWSYRGRSLGTPLIAPQHLVRDDLRSFYTLFTPNNRLYAYHLGLAASYGKTDFTFRGSHSFNFGSYSTEFPGIVRQTSLLFTMNIPLFDKKNDRLTIDLATDFGKLFPNSAALMVGWRKSGFIR
ncbi:capsule assembly Wzi family protein [Dyadobacter aurulentus]|uniref:capsule assembly Wzi family protein n=1 Tax=Dyadobacter sp. UC 10 TaxID=2605428 RepID=UPI0011F31FC2|nr:capsule assembly Wzi family protein [Dyadobacter sp. UC 10]KAA0991297.1 capsule assembly Wzi family protein [Dyadobacter sp. UC 10]